MNFFNKIKQNFLKLNIAQQISLGVLVICVPALIALGVNAIAKNTEYAEALANISSTETSSVSSEVVSSSSEEESSSFEESSSIAEPVEIFLKPSSVEEDLEVQIVDADGNMVTGYDFILTVKAKKTSYTSTWTVNDGFLRLTKLVGGDYTVTISEADGYIIKEKTIECTVKEKVKYEKVDVADKIKDEKEIDVSKEDAAVVKPVATPEPTPQTPTYENKTASVTTKITEYRYKANNIAKGDFEEADIGYILNKDGTNSIYIAKVDKDGYIVGEIRVLPANTSSETASINTVSLDAEAVWEYDLRKTFYNNSYSIKPLNIDSSIALIDDIASSSDISSAPEPEMCPDCGKEKTESCATAYCTTCTSHIGHTANDPHCSKCNVIGHNTNDTHCSSCSKYGHADNNSTNCENYVAPESTPVTSESTSESSSSENSSASSSESSSSESTSQEESSSSSSSSSNTDSDNTTSDSTSDSSSSDVSSSGPSSLSYASAVKADIYDSNDKLKDSVLTVLDLTEDHKTEKVYKNGWNEDKTSYYLADGSKVKGQVIIGGNTYNFGSDGVIVKNIAKGIDVSKYQPKVNWAQVKASGVDFVIIRVGYRGYGSGVMVEDPYFKSHIAGAKAAGLKVGVYFYSQAVTVEEAVEEASMAIQLCSGYGLQYPIYFDTEATGTGVGRADNLSKTQRTAIANAFCQTVRNSGYKAGVYASKSWFYYQLDYSQLSQYDIWLAHYASSTDFSHRYDMWQYTGSGSCPGISGAVDLNWAYKVY